MKRLIVLWLLVLPAWCAQAGSSCEPRPADAASFVKGMKLAEDSLRALDQSGAQVALIARVGQDLSKYGQHYSHMGYAWRDHPKGRWMVVHELNRCGTAESALYNEGLGNFFLDGMFAYEARIVIPDAASQSRIAAMLDSPTPLRMHAARYNMLAFPFSTRYQNSNQWLLETYAASISELGISDRTQAQGC